MKKILVAFFLIFSLFVFSSCETSKKTDGIDLEKAWNEYFRYKKRDYLNILGIGSGQVYYIKSSDVPENEKDKYYGQAKDFIEGIFVKTTFNSYDTYFRMIIATYENVHDSYSLYYTYKNCAFLGTEIEFEYFNKTKKHDNYTTDDKEQILLNYTDKTKVNIPNGILNITSHCFAGTDVEEVICNEELNTINTLAFFNAQKLRNIKLNEGLIRIEQFAFNNTKSLEYIIIPKSVIYIGYKAFNRGIIYCEDYAKKSTWEDNFFVGDAKVYYKGEWDYDELGIPYVIGE